MRDILKFSDLFDFQKKSKIKAGDGLPEGLYDFYTSSPNLKKKYDEALFENNSLVFGTGGLPSVHFANTTFSVSTDCLVAQPKKEFEVKFIYYFFLANMWILENGFKGAGLKHISKSYISNIDIPLPPKEVQRKIIKEMDEAKKLIDKRKISLQLLDDYLKAVFLEMFGDPVANPKGWEVKKMGDILDNIDGGWSPKCCNYPASGEKWGVLKLSSITSCEYIEHENKELLTEFEPRLNLEIQKGDLLFSRKNTYDLVAACAFVKNTRPKLMMSDLIFRLVIKQGTGVLPIFLWKLLINSRKRKQIQSLGNGASGSMPNISKAKLKTVDIILPPLHLQDKFVEIFWKVEEIKQSMNTQSKELDTNFNALMQGAF